MTPAALDRVRGARAACVSGGRSRRSVASRRASRCSGESGCARKNDLDRRERRFAVGGLPVQKTHPVHRIADRAGELALELARIVGGVHAGLERDDLHVEALRHRELHPAQRRVLSGGVGVEAEKEALRESG